MRNFESQINRYNIGTIFTVLLSMAKLYERVHSGPLSETLSAPGGCQAVVDKLQGGAKKVKLNVDVVRFLQFANLSNLKCCFPLLAFWCFDTPGFFVPKSHSN